MTLHGLEIGVPKGMKIILEERGINTTSFRKEDMQMILRNHEDFQNEKPRIFRFLEGKGHTALFCQHFTRSSIPSKGPGRKVRYIQRLTANTHSLHYALQYQLGLIPSLLKI